MLWFSTATKMSRVVRADSSHGDAPKGIFVLIATQVEQDFATGDKGVRIHGKLPNIEVLIFIRLSRLNCRECY